MNHSSKFLQPTCQRSRHRAASCSAANAFHSFRRRPLKRTMDVRHLILSMRFFMRMTMFALIVYSLQVVLLHIALSDAVLRAVQIKLRRNPLCSPFFSTRKTSFTSDFFTSRQRYGDFAKATWSPVMICSISLPSRCFKKHMNYEVIQRSILVNCGTKFWILCQNPYTFARSFVGLTMNMKYFNILLLNNCHEIFDKFSSL